MSTPRVPPRPRPAARLSRTGETLLTHARRAWPGIRREVLPALLVFWVNLVACGLAFAALESDDDWFRGLYWSVVTGSTTGYGDVLPQSTAATVLTIYAIASSWLLNLVVATLLIKNVIPEPHLFTDAEQRHGQAHDAVQTAHARYQTAMLEELCRHRTDADPHTDPAYRQLRDAEERLHDAEAALRDEQHERGEARAPGAP
ncbi:hypothetical protein AS188_10085 [Kocuria flava]|uniref:Potassium channel domain-containing protein n=1 Tax=Kocuria flava TaxID=446860 RepID=A0A0U2YX14_9MICC|nr:potassium channel family protein [Kocuria flava]ALU40033.1 hypothetical protein AS188_10085 [Kocuria flava]GEO91547.1 hypothetical protein KFL01_08530 [Kocuria flava]